MRCFGKFHGDFS